MAMALWLLTLVWNQVPWMYVWFICVIFAALQLRSFGWYGSCTRLLGFFAVALLLWMHHFDARMLSSSGSTEASKSPLVETLLDATWLQKGLLEGCFWGFLGGPLFWALTHSLVLKPEHFMKRFN